MPKVGADPHLTIDVDRYRKQVHVELKRLLDLMEATWGFRPPLTLKTETCLIASADFYLKDFAHQGQKSYIRPETADQRNKPTTIARRIAAELVVHRDTCKECGDGLVPLRQRVSALRSLLHPRYPGEGGWRCPPQVMRRGKKLDDHAVEQQLLRPADAVERACFPGRAAKLDRLIVEWHEACAPKPEPLTYMI
jgi:hypothetical protein